MNSQEQTDLNRVSVDGVLCQALTAPPKQLTLRLSPQDRAVFDAACLTAGVKKDRLIASFLKTIASTPPTHLAAKSLRWPIGEGLATRSSHRVDERLASEAAANARAARLDLADALRTELSAWVANHANQRQQQQHPSGANGRQ
ncbi:hypothetical protein LA345_13080 [Burkholderia vietnamiensis]|uniref:Uncharacterized protein n=1 Tax=Burkholderia vietnamiensis (strain G4 / LMG 22486) TaxID=269482 RepID=A4JFN2_BURVG|nr:hypothetical protein Bcep1808_2083 [Burkholderia vietnamiensis G4]MCB4344846.1 hypothetical protein [Burkholderia vietnamiensis]